jgi:hypothetical protein
MCIFKDFCRCFERGRNTACVCWIHKFNGMGHQMNIKATVGSAGAFYWNKFGADFIVPTELHCTYRNEVTHEF